MTFRVGENIGPYQIVEQLGQGGMATVFKAYHASLDRYVALKVLHPAFDEDKTFASRFQREARVVAKLEHPNIVPVYDYAEHEGRPYLIMKFIEGDTLKSHMTEAPMKPVEILNVVEAVGGALAYAHKQGVLHRDIKPSNVLIASDGQIYLADFGLARIAQSGESTMSSDSIMGTPQYISPEQAMGKKDLDARTDLYSFGVMVYEMVVGQVPFSADTPFAIIHDHIYTPLPLPRKVNPDVSEAVERVLMKSLAKDRSDRYEDVNTMIKAFKEVWNLATMPTVKTAAVPEPAPIVAAVQAPLTSIPTKVVEKSPAAESVSSPTQKRSPWMWVSIGLVIVLCLAGIIFARTNRLGAKLLSNRQNQNPPAVAATQPAPNQQPSAQVAQILPTLTLPPNGQQPNGNPPPPPPGQPISTTVGGEIVPPAVADAIKHVNDHPNDINAQLDLALVYWNASWFKQTYDTIAKVIQLSGMDNRDYFMQAGNKFRSQNEGWLPASILYFQAKRSYALSGDVPNHVNEAFRESYYKGSNRPETPAVLPFDVVSPIDPLMALVAQSRFAYYQGRKIEATDLLGKAKRLEDTSREAALLEGELNLKEGHLDPARQILITLVQDTSSTPDWIRQFAQQLLDGIK